MFSKDSRAIQQPAEGRRTDSFRGGSAGASIIGTGLRINGDVISDGDLQIDGLIIGDVKSRTLNLGESGEVNGAIVADQLQVGGKVVGQIKARTVNLSRTARVQGDILHETLSVEAGAFIEGAIRRVVAKEPEEKKAPAKAGAPDADEPAVEEAKPAGTVAPAKPVGAVAPATPADDAAEPAKPAGAVPPVKAAGAS